MASHASVGAVLLLAGALLAGCTGVEEEWPPSDDGATASGNPTTASGPPGAASVPAPVGVPASFAFAPAGAASTLLGDFHANVTHLDLKPAPLFPSNAALVFIPNATVAGLGEGLVVLEGEAISLAGATALRASRLDLEAGSARLTPALQDASLRTPWPAAYPPSWENANRSDGFARTWILPLDNVIVSGHARAVLLQGAQATDLGPRIIVTATRLAFSLTTTAFTDAAEVHSGGPFSVALPNATGRLRADGRDVVSALGLHAPHGDLDIEGDIVYSGDALRLTQVVTTNGVLLGAHVQAEPASAAVTLAANETKWVRVSLRETTGVGDAVLASVEVTGSGKAAINVSVDPAPSHVEGLVRALEDLSAVPDAIIVLPFAALALGIAWTFVGFAEALTCIFGCKDTTYPSWMGAGTTDEFHYRVRGLLPPGTYHADLRFKGVNHDDIVLPVDLTVTG